MNIYIILILLLQLVRRRLFPFFFAALIGGGVLFFVSHGASPLWLALPVVAGGVVVSWLSQLDR